MTPTLSESASRVYVQLAPTFFREDETYGDAGAKLIAAICAMLDPTATVVQPDGDSPGFAILFDPTNVEERWLEWLAQFPGVSLEALNLPEQEAIAREWIKHPINWTRGTVSAMRLAAQATLSGPHKLVYLQPNYVGAAGSKEKAFTIYAATLSTETPSSQATREAIESMMPAWCVLTYEAIKGGTYGELEAAGLAKYAELEALASSKKTYQELETVP